MTNLSDFRDDELDQILDAPGAVLKGATLADGTPGALQFVLETAAGAQVFREAQEHENDFVRAVAEGLRDRLTAQREAEAAARENPASAVGVAQAAEATRKAATEGRPDPERAADEAVTLTASAVALLRGRADDKDVVAYCEWLLRIARQVAGAARSRTGGLFSKRVRISDAEQAYLDRLAAAVEG